MHVFISVYFTGELVDEIGYGIGGEVNLAQIHTKEDMANFLFDIYNRDNQFVYYTVNDLVWVYWPGDEYDKDNTLIRVNKTDRHMMAGDHMEFMFADHMESWVCTTDGWDTSTIKVFEPEVLTCPNCNLTHTTNNHFTYMRWQKWPYCKRCTPAKEREKAIAEFEAEFITWTTNQHFDCDAPCTNGRYALGQNRRTGEVNYGTCFRCEGKGYQTPADRRRNFFYDLDHRRIRE